MIFEQETVAFQILDVLYLDQKMIKTYNYNRNFDALSFRFEADTVIETDKTQLELTDNNICFFPADINYTRNAKKDKMIVVNFKCFGYYSTEIESFMPAKPEKYRVLFEEMLDYWNKKSVSYKHKASSVLNRIFAELYKDNKSLENQNSKIYQSVKYIKGNCLKKDFSLKTAAEKSMISETYFRKLFHQEFGISPKKYVIQVRIKHAASLIITGYHTLQEIADICGYEDYKHFSVEFKKITGVSPSKYTYNYDILDGQRSVFIGHDK